MAQAPAARPRGNAPQSRNQPQTQQRKPAADEVNPLTSVATPPPARQSILWTVASKYNMDPVAFERTLRNTIMKPDRNGNEASAEEMAAFLVVANELSLNPLRKEIYAFKGKDGGIVPLVGIDGWITLLQRQPTYAGIDFEDIPDSNGELLGVQCTIYRTDRDRPTTVIEYLSECKRDTEPWNKMPCRMLRHRATIQCARYAYGFSGIVDEDEVDLIDRGYMSRPGEDEPRNVTPQRTALPPRREEAKPHFTPPQAEVRHDPKTGEILSDDPGPQDDGRGPLPEKKPEAPAAPSDNPADWEPMLTQLEEELDKRGNAMDVNSYWADHEGDFAGAPDSVIDRASTIKNGRIEELKAGQ